MTKDRCCADASWVTTLLWSLTTCLTLTWTHGPLWPGDRLAGESTSSDITLFGFTGLAVADPLSYDVPLALSSLQYLQL